MNASSYKVDLLSPAETEAFLTRMKGPNYLNRPLPPNHRKMVLASGFELKGEFELTARNVETGEVEWHVQQENLITDSGRTQWFYTGWTNMRLGFAPSTEIPNITRCSIFTDGVQCQNLLSGNLGSGTVTPSTYTKQWSTTFGVPNPAVVRTLGVIYMAWYQGTIVVPEMGVTNIMAYSLLTPPKTQTLTQTIEVVYKLSINPIY